MDITTSSELFNRQLHQNKIELIKNNSKDFTSKLINKDLGGR